LAISGAILRMLHKNLQFVSNTEFWRHSTVVNDFIVDCVVDNLAFL